MYSKNTNKKKKNVNTVNQPTTPQWQAKNNAIAQTEEKWKEREKPKTSIGRAGSNPHPGCVSLSNPCASGGAIPNPHLQCIPFRWPRSSSVPNECEEKKGSEEEKEDWRNKCIRHREPQRNRKRVEENLTMLQLKGVRISRSWICTGESWSVSVPFAVLNGARFLFGCIE